MPVVLGPANTAYSGMSVPACVLSACPVRRRPTGAGVRLQHGVLPDETPPGPKSRSLTLTGTCRYHDPSPSRSMIKVACSAATARTGPHCTTARIPPPTRRGQLGHHPGAAGADRPPSPRQPRPTRTPADPARRRCADSVSGTVVSARRASSWRTRRGWPIQSSCARSDGSAARTRRRRPPVTIPVEISVMFGPRNH